MKRALWVGFAAATCVLCSSGAALAGPNEELVQLTFHPTDPDVMVLRYEAGGDGLFYSRDGGQTFAMTCGTAIAPDGVPMRRLGPIALAGDGKLVLGTFDGIFEDDATGCAWSTVLSEQWVSDLVQSPSDADVMYGITSRGGDVENGLVKRGADGTWSAIGEKKKMLLSRLVVAELGNGALRFYVGGVDGNTEPDIDAGLPPQPLYAVRVSNDEGASWTQHMIGEIDGTLRLEAVDPSNPDRLVFSVSRKRDPVTNALLDDSVLVSDDGGATLREWLTLTKFGGIAFAPSGELWIGDGGDTSSLTIAQGVWHAASLDAEPELLTSDYPVNCLARRGDVLYACKRFELGSVNPESGAFTATFKFIDAPSLLACDGFDMATTCRQQLCTAFCGQAHFPVSPMCVDAYGSTVDRGCAGPLPAGTGGADGGASSGGTGSDAGNDAGTAGAGAKSDDGCTVAVPGARSAATSRLFALLAAITAALCVYRRRRRG